MVRTMAAWGGLTIRTTADRHLVHLVFAGCTMPLAWSRTRSSCCITSTATVLTRLSAGAADGATASTADGAAVSVRQAGA
jgi:hypothetical protein